MWAWCVWVNKLALGIYFWRSRFLIIVFGVNERATHNTTQHKCSSINIYFGFELFFSSNCCLFDGNQFLMKWIRHMVKNKINRNICLVNKYFQSEYIFHWYAFNFQHQSRQLAPIQRKQIFQYVSNISDIRFIIGEWSFNGNRNNTFNHLPKNDEKKNPITQLIWCTDMQ